MLDGGIAPPSGSSMPSSFDPKKLAALLGDSSVGSGQPDMTMQGGPMALGNGQDTYQMTYQGYPMGGTGQFMNKQNFLGAQAPSTMNPSLPSWFTSGGGQ